MSSRRASSRPLLSVCFIVRDEAHRLPRALGSVCGVAHEVVIVDTGSTDATPDIAARSGARVLRATWSDDFAAARNVSLAAARGDWILCLDADEELAPGQDDAVQAHLARRDVDAWTVRIRSTLSGAQAGVEFWHEFPRLFRNRIGVRFTGRVHEQVGPALAAVAARVGRSDLVLLHSGYVLDADGRRAKLERNLHLLELDREERPHDGFVHFHLGETLAQLGRMADAAGWYQHALAATTLDRVHRATASQNLAGVLVRLGRARDAAVAALNALRLDRSTLPAWLHLAAAYTQMHRYDGALRAARRYLAEIERGDPLARTHAFTADPPRAWLVIAECHLRQGRLDDAEAALEPIVAARTEWGPGLRLAARIALQRNDSPRAVLYLRRATACEPDNAAGWRELMRVQAESGDAAGALASADAVAARLDDAGLYRLQGALRIHLGFLAEAVASYEQVLRLEAGAPDAHRRLAGLYHKCGDAERARRHLELLRAGPGVTASDARNASVGRVGSDAHPGAAPRNVPGAQVPAPSDDQFLEAKIIVPVLDCMEARADATACGSAHLARTES